MGFSNRKVLLLNKDVPIYTSISPLSPHIQNISSPPESMTSSPPSMFGMSVRFLPHPIFISNFAHAFLIPFSALLFLTILFFLYVRHLSIVGSSSSTPRRQGGDHHPLFQGVDPTIVKSLPVCSYNREENKLDCAICLEEYQVGDEVKMIPHCRHLFHPECIDMWLSEHMTCPICRCTQFVDDDEHGEGSTAENGEEVGSESPSSSVSSA